MSDNTLLILAAGALAYFYFTGAFGNGDSIANTGEATTASPANRGTRHDSGAAQVIASTREELAALRYYASTNGGGPGGSHPDAAAQAEIYAQVRAAGAVASQPPPPARAIYGGTPNVSLGGPGSPRTTSTGTSLSLVSAPAAYR